MLVSQEVSQLRKSGRLRESLDLAREGFTATPQDRYLQMAYGWVLYDLLKVELQDLELHRVTPSRFAQNFEQWINEYRQLDNIQCPDLLHSLMLTKAVKASKVWPGFLAFAWHWNPACFRTEDKEPYSTPDGKSVPSLELRFYYAVGRAAVEHRSGANEDLLHWAEESLLLASSKHPDDLWLSYYKSKLLLDAGKVDSAREFLWPVLRRQQRAGWAWSLLGHTYEHEEPETAITCFCHAIRLAQKPVEALNVRVHLAGLLVAAGRLEEAAHQVKIALGIRQDNGWSIPNELGQLVRSDWYRRYGTQADLPPDPDVSAAAEEILFGGALEFRLGVIDHQNPGKELAYVVFSPEDGTVLYYRKFKGLEKKPPGTLLEVGFSPDTKRAVQLRMAPKREIPDLYRHFQGELVLRDGQAFGFIHTDGGDRVFVPPPVMGRFEGSSGLLVRCSAVRSLDTKRGTVSWKAVTLSMQAEHG